MLLQQQQQLPTLTSVLEGTTTCQARSVINGGENKRVENKGVWLAIFVTKGELHKLKKKKSKSSKCLNHYEARVKAVL